MPRKSDRVETAETADAEVRVPLSTEIRPTLRERLDAHVDRSRMTIRGVVETALEDYLDCQEAELA